MFIVALAFPFIFVFVPNLCTFTFSKCSACHNTTQQWCDWLLYVRHFVRQHSANFMQNVSSSYVAIGLQAKKSGADMNSVGWMFKAQTSASFYGNPNARSAVYFAAREYFCSLWKRNPHLEPLVGVLRCDNLGRSISAVFRHHFMFLLRPVCLIAMHLMLFRFGWNKMSEILFLKWKSYNCSSAESNDLVMQIRNRTQSLCFCCMIEPVAACNQ